MFHRCFSLLVLAAFFSVLLGFAPRLAFAAPSPANSSNAGLIAATKAKEDAEEVAPDSPRASVGRYLELCRKGSYAEAAAYLDVPSKDGARAALLAEQLYVVLNRYLIIEPELLSAHSAGRKDDPLPQASDELGRIRDRTGHMLPVRLVRKEAKDDQDARWVFSAATVAHVPGWYDTLEDHAVRKHLPAFFLREGYKSLLYWQWLALPLLFVVAIIFARALSVPVLGLLKLGSRWWSNKIWHGALARARGPVSLALSLPLVLLVLPRLSLYLAGEVFVLRVIKALAFTALFWLLMRLVLVVGAIASEDPAAIGKAARVSLARMGERAGRVFLATIGVVVVLSELGYSVTNIVAGLGLGGVALALAAQKTVEHLFGSVSILADQPFRAGDYIKVDGIEGTVEHIGFRSTRIRTPDRTLIILPNGKLADMRIENVAYRDRFRFALRLPLDALTAGSQALLLTAKIRALLESREDVSPDDLLVRVKTVSELALELEVSAYVLVGTVAQFAEVREVLVLGIHQAMQDLHVALPHPALEIKTAAAAAAPATAETKS